METNDILQQEPQVEETADKEQVTGYVAYLNLDYLNIVFADLGYQDKPEKQKEYIDGMIEKLADVLLRHERGVMPSWSWYNEKDQLRRAIELMPVSSDIKGLKVVTPDVTGYEDMKKEIMELRNEVAMLRGQAQQMKDSLKNHGITANFDRQPGGLVEQFEKGKEGW